MESQKDKESRRKAQLALLESLDHLIDGEEHHGIIEYRGYRLHTRVSTGFYAGIEVTLDLQLRP